MDFNQETEIDNEFFFDKMFRTCAKEIFNQDAKFNRLYEMEYLQQLAEKAQDQQSKIDISRQKMKTKKQIDLVKEMYFICFNRFFYAYNIMKEVGYDIEDQDDLDE